MLTLRYTLSLLALCLASITFAAAAQAQTTQLTFVSTSGSDSNAAWLRSAANPCRSFAAAQSVTGAGGEIVALTSGGYAPVEITKALQISAPAGVQAVITAHTRNAIGGQDAIRISAGSSDAVTLRGLTLNNSGAQNGINFDSGAALHTENCVINGFAEGILFDAAGKLFVKDTIVRNSSLRGIYIATSFDTIQAAIDRSRFENNGLFGVVIFQNARVSLNDSVVAGNGDAGVVIDGGGQLTATRTTSTNNGAEGFSVRGSGSQLTASQSIAAGNASGFSAQNGAQMTLDGCVANGRGNTGNGVIATGTGTVARVASTTATNNFTGFRQGSDAVFESYRNNRARGNAVQTAGTITAVGEI